MSWRLAKVDVVTVVALVVVKELWQLLQDFAQYTLKGTLATVKIFEQ